MKTITYILKCTDCDYTEKQQIVVPDNAKAWCEGEQVLDGRVIEGQCPDCRERIEAVKSEIRG